MKKHKFSGGFTLVELLMVVAIIGILATVVMGSVTDARAKAVNVAIKSTLANLRAQATLVYGSANPNSYDDVCTNNSFVQGLDSVSALTVTTAKCFNSDEAWVAASVLKVPENTFTAWCVDSSGKSKGVTEAEFDGITSASTLCPS